MSSPARTYVRFVCFKSVGRQRSRLGLFKAIDEAVESEHEPSWAIVEARTIASWFNENLAIPKVFSVGGHKGFGQPGLSWFKPAAGEHIRQMHRLKLALEACGVHVEVLTTRDPGLIVWQDENQLVAEPRGRKF
ncbi:hypothetical protein HZ989_05065 [Brevundimonas sp. AJA228-03]|uniref:hypothetical protein n=1 Tax=Brevundimonas sp. AJA228-03 TaxID=2752515 RepID=UPI001AE06E0B|nr:hypothetical protein [Brevundimonas sp. AJA228-03]QTN20436.1 hypothetical protein HZ989_05065 [Brevundimonas sp. AJA228-03]